MIKRLLSLLICLTITSTFSIASAHGTFTWFGLRKDNTEVVIQSSGHNPHHHNCCHHKPKPKHKPKPHHHKKGPNHHKWWKH